MHYGVQWDNRFLPFCLLPLPLRKGRFKFGPQLWIGSWRAILGYIFCITRGCLRQLVSYFLSRMYVVYEEAERRSSMPRQRATLGRLAAESTPWSQKKSSKNSVGHVHTTSTLQIDYFGNTLFFVVNIVTCMVPVRCTATTRIEIKENFPLWKKNNLEGALM